MIAAIAAIGEEVRLRLEANRLVEVGDGAVVVAIGFIVETAIVVKQRIGLIERDCRVVVGDGLLVAAEFLCRPRRGWNRFVRAWDRA